MGHLALYRTWRPQRFDEVVGQEQTVQALKNSVRMNQTSHAYLFAGPRGTGKTSLAKILARAVNCERPEDGEPCNQCQTCQDILSGNFMDVIEIDAASNRGIDEIRDLREQVKILPAQGRKKVYIIDEVHMLTTEAFNALLKTLEEPPENVLFILATTEVQKIPATILSRCQKYRFLRLSPEQIVQRLQEVASSEGITAAPEALELLARRANGGMRDALGMLDQMISYRGKNLSREDVMQGLGMVDDTLLADIFQAVQLNHPAEIIENLAQAFIHGLDARQIAREGAWYLRDVLMFQILGERAEFQRMSESGLPRVKEQAENLDRESILRALQKMMELSEQLRFGEDPRFLLEMTFLGLIDLFQGRELMVEEQPEPRANEKQRKRAVSEPAPKDAAKPQTKPATEAPEENAFWQQVLAGVKAEKITTHAMLAEGNFIGIHGDVAYISYRKGYRFHKEKMEEKENRLLVQEVMRKISGKEIQLEFILQDDPKYNDLLVKKAIEVFGENKVKVLD